MSYCMMTLEMLAARWFQESALVRVRGSNQETKNQDCIQLLSGILV